jgi:hypothetical protein
MILAAVINTKSLLKNISAAAPCGMLLGKRCLRLSGFADPRRN